MSLPFPAGSACPPKVVKVHRPTVHVSWSHKDVCTPRLESVLCWSQILKEGQTVWESWGEESSPTGLTRMVAFLLCAQPNPLLLRLSLCQAVKPVALKPRRVNNTYLPRTSQVRKVCIFTNTKEHSASSILFRFFLHLCQMKMWVKITFRN